MSAGFRHFQSFAGLSSHTKFIASMDPDLESKRFWPNQTSRQVQSGHYVTVQPRPLSSPELILHSGALFKTFGLDEGAIADPNFVNFFAGDVEGAGKAAGFSGAAWATPYALAIYGRRYTDNCPFKNGKGYGDGRALSIAEISTPGAGSWELQLKGAGPTPFCRGADGRAVLRSSIREFLASEANHCLGVSTTRALTLVASKDMTINRPWYSSSHQEKSSRVDVPSLDDPRLQQYQPHVRKQVLQHVLSDVRQPDKMVPHRCAITCRAAPSFVRIGHLDLFARRVERGGAEASLAREQLVQLTHHALLREGFGDVGGAGYGKDQGVPDVPSSPEAIQAMALSLLRESSARIARLTADWIRVGFCQGNFNSDNCLVAGRTMDYGPFGYIEKFEPLWNMWTGGGEHFGFLNQPEAGAKNFSILVQAMAPLMCNSVGEKELEGIVAAHSSAARREVNDVWRRKLGLKEWTEQAEALRERLFELMEDSEADYTLLWRQLASYPTSGLTAESPCNLLLEPLLDPLVFYRNGAMPGAEGDRWCAWLRDWLALVMATDGARSAEEASRMMNQASPKYVPREWMLVHAYLEAEKGNYGPVKELHVLFQDPYAEGPEPEGFAEKYYRKAPLETYEGVGLGGTAYMT
jgi:uncharacterized protein YdiU (UPF0061 family)|eukprot:g5150.t1